MDGREVIGHHDQTAAGVAGKLGQRALDLCGITHRSRERPHADGGGSGFYRLQEVASAGWRGIAVEHDRDARYSRCDLLEQFHPLSAHCREAVGETGCIASRPRQACNEAVADRIRGRHENNRYRSGFPQDRGNNR